MATTYLILAASFAVIFAPAAMFVLQLLGVKWAYRIGFPMAEFYARTDVHAQLSDSTEWAKIKLRDGAALISEQSWPKNPTRSLWTSRWPDTVMGIAELCGGESKLVLRADTVTSFLWISEGVIALICVWGVVTKMPGVREPIGMIVILGFGLVCFGGLVFFVRSARRRAVAFAEHLGFTKA